MQKTTYRDVSDNINYIWQQEDRLRHSELLQNSIWMLTKEQNILDAELQYWVLQVD